MFTHRCPGMDVRFWKPKDIFEIRCPYCGETIEFWKDDPLRNCPGCGQVVSNPQIDLSCAKWCQYAEECVGALSDTLVQEAPVIDRLKALLEKHLTGQPTRMNFARAACVRAETLMAAEGGEPCVVKSGALLAGALMTENGISAASSSDNNPLRDPLARKTILEQAGIGTALANETCAVVDGIISGKTQETLDFTVVWDAVQLERLSLIHDSDTRPVVPDTITKTIRTRSGKRMAEHIIK